MRRMAVVVLILAATWASPVFANVTQTITIDENNPTVSLPFPVVSGKVIIFEFEHHGESDIILFSAPPPGSTQSSVLYCSDNFDGTDLTADFVPLNTCNKTGVPFVLLLEPREGRNQVISYIPTAGQPGFADPVTYIIKGDAATTPEPGSLLLLGSGLCALARRIRRR
jgi:PEP-CTERM motif